MSDALARPVQFTLIAKDLNTAYLQQQLQIHGAARLSSYVSDMAPMEGKAGRAFSLTATLFQEEISQVLEDVQKIQPHLTVFVQQTDFSLTIIFSPPMVYGSDVVEASSQVLNDLYDAYSEMHDIQESLAKFESDNNAVNMWPLLSPHSTPIFETQGAKKLEKTVPFSVFLAALALQKLNQEDYAAAFHIALQTKHAAYAFLVNLISANNIEVAHAFKDAVIASKRIPITKEIANLLIQHGLDKELIRLAKQVAMTEKFLRRAITSLNYITLVSEDMRDKVARAFEGASGDITWKEAEQYAVEIKEFLRELDYEIEERLNNKEYDRGIEKGEIIRAIRNDILLSYDEEAIDDIVHKASSLVKYREKVISNVRKQQAFRRMAAFPGAIMRYTMPSSPVVFRYIYDRMSNNDKLSFWKQAKERGIDVEPPKTASTSQVAFAAKAVTSTHMGEEERAEVLSMVGQILQNEGVVPILLVDMSFSMEVAAEITRRIIGHLRNFGAKNYYIITYSDLFYNVFRNPSEDFSYRPSGMTPYLPTLYITANFAKHLYETGKKPIVISITDAQENSKSVYKRITQVLPNEDEFFPDEITYGEKESNELRNLSVRLPMVFVYITQTGVDPNSSVMKAHERFRTVELIVSPRDNPEEAAQQILQEIIQFHSYLKTERYSVSIPFYDKSLEAVINAIEKKEPLGVLRYRVIE